MDIIKHHFRRTKYACFIHINGELFSGGGLSEIVQLETYLPTTVCLFLNIVFIIKSSIHLNFIDSWEYFVIITNGN